MIFDGNMDAGSQDHHLEATISKEFASELAWGVCDETIQVLVRILKETMIFFDFLLSYQNSRNSVCWKSLERITKSF